jgi:amino acid transporter
MRLGTIAETINDVENGPVLDANVPSRRPTSEREPNHEVTTEALPLDLFNRFVDSFRRDKNQSITPQGVIGGDGRVYNPKNAALATANTALQRNLKSRHLQMIAFGGSIGEILSDVMISALNDS